MLLFTPYNVSSPITQPPAYGDVFSHHDASDAATITDTSGAVDQWDDKKNANDLTATTTARPSTGTVTIGGLNAIDFDGVNHIMAKTGATDIGNGAVAITVAFVALLRNSPTSDGGVVAYGTPSAGALFGVSQLGNGGSSELTSRFFNGYVESDLTWSDGTAYLCVVSIPAGQNYSNVTWHINGSSTGVTNNNTNSLNMTSTKNLAFGSYEAGGTDIFNGALGEVVFYSKFISQSEREILEGYLAHKWGLEGSLPGGHPYKSSPPTS